MRAGTKGDGRHGDCFLKRDSSLVVVFLLVLVVLRVVDLSPFSSMSCPCPLSFLSSLAMSFFQLGSGLSGAQGGTVFADPILSKQMAQGKLTKSSIDRFTIVLMGGIAAEAINYGSSEVCIRAHRRRRRICSPLAAVEYRFGWSKACQRFSSGSLAGCFPEFSPLGTPFGWRR